MTALKERGREGDEKIKGTVPFSPRSTESNSNQIKVGLFEGYPSSSRLGARCLFVPEGLGNQGDFAPLCGRLCAILRYEITKPDNTLAPTKRAEERFFLRLSERFHRYPKSPREPASSSSSRFFPWKRRRLPLLPRA